MNQNQPSALSVTSAHNELDDIIRSKYDGDFSAQLHSRKLGSLKDKKSSIKYTSKVQRGNLGFCPLDMSLINLCGVPSLWLEPKDFVTKGSKIVTVD